MTDLTELGLQSYQDKAYRTLVHLGTASAQELSEKSDVPRGRIYDVLSRLESEKLVRRHDATDPRQYSPVNPDIAIDRLLDKRKAELNQQRQRYVESAEKLASQLPTPTPVEGRVWTTAIGPQETLDLWKERVKAADDEICWVLSFIKEDVEWLDRQQEQLQSLYSTIEDDVSVRILIASGLVDGLSSQIPIRKHLELNEYPDIAVRRTDDVYTTFDIIDNREVCLDIHAPFEPVKRVGIVDVHEEAFARQMKKQFHYIWEDAVKIS